MTQVRDVRIRPDLLCLASGWDTLITDVHGRIAGQGTQGFFAQGTRMLCRERITVDGREPVAFSTAVVGAHAQISYAEVGHGERMPSEAVYLTVERFLGGGLRSRFTVHSWAATPRTLTLRLDVAADFADLDEAEQGQRRQNADVTAEWNADAHELRLAYDHPRLDLAVALRWEGPVPVRRCERSVSVDLVVDPGESAAVMSWPSRSSTDSGTRRRRPAMPSRMICRGGPVPRWPTR